MTAEHGEVTPIVAGGAVLFVGVLMFLIDDDDAEVGQWSEDCTAGANDNTRFALADTMPFIKTLALREV